MEVEKVMFQNITLKTSAIPSHPLRGGIGKDSYTGMYNTTPYVLIEYEV